MKKRECALTCDFSCCSSQPMICIEIGINAVMCLTGGIRNLGNRLGRKLEITQDDLQIIKIDHSFSVMEQGFQMLLKWFQSCDPAKRTPQTLKEALLETECFTALECLLLDIS
ncbi:E3 ubiquitin-protein ligase MIB2-like isoform X3 [Octopus vulgaris]|uniref:E3 ubiquitin-protein ligase MIB2-like isoform X3 n=1 Tax=Octopus vulgaris TaxID=6645 RepID=A0AA36C0W1_OCTVU|nr:E3 ubiquitin-protein ligase MIB2-like isoform X3 [Octopus vulgaris]